VPFVDGIARLGCGRVSIGVAALWMALGSVASPASADTLSGGVQHSVIRTPDGHVWAFGGNGNGQLGDGTTTAKTVPIEVPSLTNVVAVAAGGITPVPQGRRHGVGGGPEHGASWATGATRSGRRRSRCSRSHR
jgi:hypothetical protein